ncbi:TIGR03862 family flavoprotein [Aliishimia ponticola]|uniref:TIGR03862 family flavoprotein n=1 Tax=Aliishimia ponticola TaxID=2499833 RepID=A0A4S4NBC2_9RHOB|nr:TIGR03862 family flavoprotein [Aliishimia ponticola]THH36619.1 TIGR03862 family flavoprotein [Aliishimia ponticola]
MVSAAVIGAGPAGLMAAQVMAEAGLTVTVYDAKPSPARKFLMAGKSGLNLTFDGGRDKLMAGYGDRADALRPALEAFDNRAVQHWAEGLGIALFTGSTGRVFPEAMKASPLLRAWLARLDQAGVTLRTGWRWTGWSGDGLQFDTKEGAQRVLADVTVLACGGASWSRLGSDGAWADWVPSVPFQPANVGLRVEWSAHMEKFRGAPIKGVAWRAGDVTSRGEAVISGDGLEGGGIYTVSAAVRAGRGLLVDLLPDLKAQDVAERLSRPRGKDSLSNHLRKSLRLTPIKLALLREWAGPLPKAPEVLAATIKGLNVPVQGLGDMDGAISTAGGVPFDALDDGYMLRARPGVFCAGEMLDWEAPTGGWLLTACVATGAWAGRHAAGWVR